MFSDSLFFFFFQAEDGIRDLTVTGVDVCSSDLPQGFLIDGHTDAAEGAFDAKGDWFVLAGHDAGLLFVTRLSENLASAIPLRLVYRDEIGRASCRGRAEISVGAGSLKKKSESGW